MACPDDNTILAFVEQELSPEQAQAVERHLDGCPPCRKLFSRIARAFNLPTESGDVTLEGSDTVELPDEERWTRSATGPILEPGAPVSHFQVIRLLGRGGMGEVYLARDLDLGRKVALKVVAPTTLGSRRAIERFLVEARITARFNHPHIVTIHEVGEDQGRPYLALEYLQGQTLQQRLEEDRPGIQEILRIGRAIASALAEAHASGVLHRDLKPANVMLAQDGRLRVLDFGLAKFQGPDEGPPREASQAAASLGAEGLTHPRGICGSPAYMAPEQWRRQETTGATDVWALGVILFQLLTDRLPYVERKLSELSQRVCSDEPAPPVGRYTQVPGSLAAVVAQCLRKEAAARPTAGELVQRFQELLSGEAVPLAEGASPFRGLLPFGEQHRHLFFGREQEITHFVERLRQEQVLPVIGASAAGKSSFVQAGVIPRLRERGPVAVVQLRPGGRPFRALAERLMAARYAPSSDDGPFGPSSDTHPSSPDLAEDSAKENAEQLAHRLQTSPPLLNLMLHRLSNRLGASVLLFVDQLEELFTLNDDHEVQQRFMEAICTAADDPAVPVRVVFTLREEFLSRAAEGPVTREALSRITVLRSPGPAMLEEILTRPVEATGYSYDDPRLVQEMVAEVKAEVACLPLLQFAGQMLWEHRDMARRRLLRSAYVGLGGVAGALAQHADGVLRALPAEATRVARTIFLRLVTPEGTRRLLARDRLLAGLGAEAEEVLQRLCAARLLTARQLQEGQEVELELVHESLVRTWGRLRRWIDESREELSFLAEIEQAAELWERRGRREEEVWQGEALRDATRTVERCTTEVPEVVLRFLETGRARERRRARRRRIWLGLAGTLLVLGALVALAVALVVVGQKRAVEAQRAEAQREGARAAGRSGDLLEARAKLRGSLETQDSALSRVLWWQLSRDPLVWRQTLGAVVHRLARSPDGKLVAVACSDKAVYLFETETRALRRILRGHGDQVLCVAFSPDGRQLVSGSWSGEVRLWDLASGRGRPVQGRHAGGTWDAAYCPDSSCVATCGDDGRVRLWDPRTGQPLRVLRGHGGKVFGVAVSPDGKTLASAGLDNKVWLWDPRDGRQLRPFAHPAPAHHVAFSPDGRTLATGAADGLVRLYDLIGGGTPRVLEGHGAAVWAVHFSPDGMTLASGGKDRTVRLWNVARGELEGVLAGHGAMVLGLSFGADGRHLFTSSMDRAVRRWEAQGTGGAPPPERPVGHGSMVVGIAINPDGRLVASGGEDATIRLWDVATGQQLRVLRGHGAKVFGLSFSPDGKTLASGSTDRSLRLWDVASGEERKVLLGHTDKVFDVHFRPDGKLLASGGADATVRLWAMPEGEQRQILSRHRGAVHGVRFSPDGRLLASSGNDGVVQIWDGTSGRALRALEEHTSEAWGVDFSSDGKTLASGRTDGTVDLWEVASWVGRTVGRQEGRVYWVAVDPVHGRIGAPGSADVRLWTREGRSIPLVGHRAEVNWLRFSADGKLAATSSDDGTVRLWAIGQDSVRPRWRAPALLREPGGGVWLYSHRGRQRLDGQSAAHRSRWRQAILSRARRAALSPDGGLLCLATLDGTLEIWDPGADRSTASQQLPGLREVVALPAGCLTLDGQAVRIVSRDGHSRVLVDNEARAVSHDAQGLLVAAGERVQLFTGSGQPRPAPPLETDVGVTALTRAPPWLVLGYRDGNVELLALKSGKRRTNFSLEEVPASPVERMLVGPMDTLVVGFAGGQLGLWDLTTGRRLHHTRLHGPVIHLHRLEHDGRLYAASELGSHQVWDLTALRMPYCELLREVWRQVAVVWEQGRPVARRPPADHPCRRR